MTVHLRAPHQSDEADLRRLHAQLQDDNFDFLLSQGNWDDILSEIEREARGTELAPGRVRAEFLVAEVYGVPSDGSRFVTPSQTSCSRSVGMSGTQLGPSSGAGGMRSRSSSSPWPVWLGTGCIEPSSPAMTATLRQLP